MHIYSLISGELQRDRSSDQVRLRLLRMDSGSSEQSRGRGKNKRTWSATEDALLVEIMLDLRVSGKAKSDNGFKPGTFVQIEKLLEGKLPGCGIRASPHIESRVKTLKYKYNAIHDMLFNSSGFAWDDDKKMVICEKEAYDIWVKSHKDAVGLWLKPFPHFDDLGIVFGKDRANGKGVVSAADLREEVNEEENANIDISVDDTDTDVSVTQPPTLMPETSNQSGRKRKRSTDTYLSGFSDMVDAMTKTAESMHKLVACLSEPQPEPVDKMSKVFDEVSKIPDLNEFEMLEVSPIIMKDPVKVNLLFSLPNHLKKHWVDKLLHFE